MMLLLLLVTVATVATASQVERTSRECGGINEGENGYFMSPNFPNTYNGSQQCVWVVRTPVGTTVSVTFSEFDIYTSTPGGCSSGYVEIRSGKDETGTLIGQYCGSTIPAARAQSNSMWIKFVGGSQNAGRGFRATYTSSCGYTLTAPSGSLLSQGYPQYANGLDCIYRINQPEGSVISLTFDTFQLESSNNCAFDFFKIYDGPTEDSTLLGTYCGDNMPPSFTSRGNHLYFQFKTDLSVSHKGFLATYRIVNNGASVAPGGSTVLPPTSASGNNEDP